MEYLKSIPRGRTNSSENIQAIIPTPSEAVKQVNITVKNGSAKRQHRKEHRRTLSDSDIFSHSGILSPTHHNRHSPTQPKSALDITNEEIIAHEVHEQPATSLNINITNKPHRVSKVAQPNQNLAIKPKAICEDKSKAISEEDVLGEENFEKSEKLEKIEKLQESKSFVKKLGQRLSPLNVSLATKLQASEDAFRSSSGSSSPVSDSGINSRTKYYTKLKLSETHNQKPLSLMNISMHQSLSQSTFSNSSTPPEDSSLMKWITSKWNKFKDRLGDKKKEELKLSDSQLITSTKRRDSDSCSTDSIDLICRICERVVSSV